jgi:hypothetical protein
MQFQFHIIKYIPKFLPRAEERYLYKERPRNFEKSVTILM